MDIPATMKAAQAVRFGDARDVLTVSPAVPRPPAPPRNHVLIRVHACSLSPGDYRMLSGAGDLIKKPPRNGWPYIPGGDIAGEVVAVHPSETRFKPRDRVLATWDTFGMGGLAEFATVNTKYVEHLPDGVSWLEGAAMADSPVNAMLAVEDARLAKGDRLLILGGSGAVGTHLIQLARHAGVEYIATTSTDDKLCRSLGADLVVNYRETDWWTVPEICERPFDVVIDCAEGVQAWDRVREHALLKTGKEGGRFLAVVVNEWHIEIHTCWQMIAWMAPVVGRAICACMNSAKMPSYKMLFPAPRGDSLKRFLKLMEETQLKIVLDPASPFEFSTKGVREAFEMMVERRAHGKVVIAIRDD